MGQFKPGQSGNPAGRPKGAKTGTKGGISARLLRDLEAAWRKHGKAALDELAESNPGKFVDVCLRVLPKEANVNVNGTVNHESAGLSVAAEFIREAIERGKDRPLKDVTPGRPVLSASVRSES